MNGGFLQNRAKRLADPIRAKCLVLDDGSTRLAIVVVDSCMMPRELLDRAKQFAEEKTGIPVDQILISATHAHSAPAAMGALGCPADANYVARLPGWIAETIERATKCLSRPVSDGTWSTTMTTRFAVAGSAVPIRCSTTHSASERSAPICILAIKTSTPSRPPARSIQV